MVIGHGDRRKVRMEEMDEYHFLGVIIRARGCIFMMQERNWVRKTKQQGGASDCILQGE